MAVAALKREVYEYLDDGSSSSSDDEGKDKEIKTNARKPKKKGSENKEGNESKDKEGKHAEAILRQKVQNYESNKTNSKNKSSSKKKADNDVRNDKAKDQKKNKKDIDDSSYSSSDEGGDKIKKNTKNIKKEKKDADWAAPYKEFKRNTIYQRIREDIKKQDSEMIRRAIKEAETIGMKKDDKYLVTARNIARALEERNKLRTVVKKGNTEAIKNEIDVINKNMYFYVEYCPGIQREVFEAQRRLEEIERAKKKEREIHIVINQRTMSAINGFKKPPQKVHRVMQGAFLLLGYDLDSTSTWSVITSKCNSSTLKEILDFDATKLHPDIAATAKQVLSEQNMKSLRSISEAAVSFYVWGMGTADACIKVNGKGKVVGVKRQKEIFATKFVSNKEKSSAPPKTDDAKTNVPAPEDKDNDQRLGDDSKSTTNK